MADVMGEAQRLGQILVKAQRTRDRPPDLGDLKAMGQANAKMVAVGRDEDLRLVAEPPETDRMNDAVAVALEGSAGPARFAGDLEMLATATERGVAREHGQ
jgi:hypothetical protein